MVDVPAPPAREEIAALVHEVVILNPQERVQQRIGGQLVECPVTEVFQDIAEVERFVPQARVQRIDEQIVEESFPQIL